LEITVSCDKIYRTEENEKDKTYFEKKDDREKVIGERIFRIRYYELTLLVRETEKIVM